MDAREVIDHLLKTAQWTASRSSGPGGQHRDKASTRAELTLDADSLEGLDPHLARRLMQALGLDERPLRIAIQDVELAGVSIPAGTIVIANTGAANRDPTVCDDPDRLDITRADAPPIQTFGGGMHYCLGANLARLELSEALAIMTPRRRCT